MLRMAILYGASRGILRQMPTNFSRNVGSHTSYLTAHSQKGEFPFRVMAENPCQFIGRMYLAIGMGNRYNEHRKGAGRQTVMPRL